MKGFEPAAEEKKKVKEKTSCRDDKLVTTGSSKKKSSGSDDQWHIDTSIEAVRQRIEEAQLSSVTAELVMLTTDHKQAKKKPKAGADDNGDMAHEKPVLEEVKAIIKKGVGASQLRSSLSQLSDSSQEVMTARLFEALLDGVEKGFAKEVAKKKLRPF